MVAQSLKQSRSPANGPTNIVTLGASIICFGVFGLLLVLILVQVVNPPPVRRLVIEHDYPLPGALPNKYIPDLRTTVQNQGPLTPGVAVRFDHFDFQAFDPKTKLLFIAHTGPAPDVVETFGTGFSADKNADVDGQVLVFDTQQKKLIKNLPIPQVAGIVAAPELGHVYAADSNDSIVYDIDEKTFKFSQIQIGDNESPDAIEYDPDDQQLFVSDVGAPAPDAKDQANPSPDNQNIAVIDLRTRKVTKINLGHMPKLSGENAELVKFGYDVGHNKYDSVLHRVFVTTSQLTDQGIVPAPPDTPAGVGELIEINPMTEMVISRLQLPTTCGVPHGLNIDAENNVAFIACTEVSEEQDLTQNLIRVDVRTMKVIPGSSMPLPAKPDLIRIDQKLHTLFVACAAGVAVFDIQKGTLTSLGSYILGKGTHTMAINEETNEIYLPQPDIGGRPTLRIVIYYPNGA